METSAIPIAIEGRVRDEGRFRREGEIGLIIGGDTSEEDQLVARYSLTVSSFYSISADLGQKIVPVESELVSHRTPPQVGHVAGQVLVRDVSQAEKKN